MDNPSTVPHAVGIEGNGVDVDGKTVEQGGVSTATADLKPGTYEFYCPVDGHAQAGHEGRPDRQVTCEGPAKGRALQFAYRLCSVGVALDDLALAHRLTHDRALTDDGAAAAVGPHRHPQEREDQADDAHDHQDQPDDVEVDSLDVRR